MHPWRRWLLMGAAASLGGVGALEGCSTIAGMDDLTIGACKGGVCPDDGSADADIALDDSGPVQTDDGGMGCSGKQGPVMLRVGSPDNTFCIDTTEVSNEQYKAFLDAKVPTTSQPPACYWNTSFTQADFRDGGPAPSPKEPVVGVDWCDALAYCTWAGKYLCGRVDNGKKSGPVTAEAKEDVRSHQWLLACTAEGRLSFAYGGLFDATKCNLADYDAGKALPVGTVSTCIGGYKGIYDMMGNVWEWFDGCRSDAGLDAPDAGDGGAQQHACWVKGGSYLDRNGGAINCRNDAIVRRDQRQVNIGIRCCSD